MAAIAREEVIPVATLSRKDRDHFPGELRRHFLSAEKSNDLAVSRLPKDIAYGNLLHPYLRSTRLRYKSDFLKLGQSVTLM